MRQMETAAAEEEAGPDSIKSANTSIQTNQSRSCRSTICSLVGKPVSSKEELIDTESHLSIGHLEEDDIAEDDAKETG